MPDELETQAGLLSQLDAGVQNFMGAFPAGSRGLSPVILHLQRVRPASRVELEWRHRPRLSKHRHRRWTLGERRLLRRHAELDEARRPRQLPPHDRHPPRRTRRYWPTSWASSPKDFVGARSRRWVSLRLRAFDNRDRHPVRPGEPPRWQLRTGPSTTTVPEARPRAERAGSCRSIAVHLAARQR